MRLSSQSSVIVSVYKNVPCLYVQILSTVSDDVIKIIGFNSDNESVRVWLIECISKKCSKTDHFISQLVLA